MKNRSQILLGGFIALLGVWLLLGQVFRIDLGRFCWPVGLMVLGAAILLRPRMLPPGTEHTVLPFGDLRRKGPWNVGAEEIWMFAGDVRLDLTQANIPEGETTIRVISFVSDLDVDVPQGVAVRVSGSAVVGDVRVPGRKEDVFLTTATWASDAYDDETSRRRLNVEVTAFVVDLDVRTVEA